MVAVGHLDMEAQEAQKRGALRMRPRSLKFRLIAISLAWLAFSLLATGAVLVLLFRAHMQRHFDQALQSHLEELVAAASGDADGSLNLSWEPADPRFRKPLSGWYWESPQRQRNAEAFAITHRSKHPGGDRQPAEPHIFDNIPGPGERAAPHYRPGYRFTRIEPAAVRACGRPLRHGSERRADLHGPARGGAHHAWPDA